MGRRRNRLLICSRPRVSGHAQRPADAGPARRCYLAGGFVRRRKRCIRSLCSRRIDDRTADPWAVARIMQCGWYKKSRQRSRQSLLTVDTTSGRFPRPSITPVPRPSCDPIRAAHREHRGYWSDHAQSRPVPIALVRLCPVNPSPPRSARRPARSHSRSCREALDRSSCAWVR
jgi:hypothetical protein